MQDIPGRAVIQLRPDSPFRSTASQRSPSPGDFAALRLRPLPAKSGERLRWLPYSQHEPHVLHGRARGALAEVVEPRDQNGLAMLRAGEHIELEPVGLVERFRLQ